MSQIRQIYCKAPDKASLNADLVAQGLATETEKGVQRKIGVTTWTPLEQEDDPDTDTDESVQADYILALIGWTAQSMREAGLTQAEVDRLLNAGTLANGTEVDVDVSSLGLADSEPRLKTYGA